MKKILEDFKISYDQTKYIMKDIGGQHEPDTNFYEANSFRLRSPELSDDADIVIMGCSFSYGVGVPEHMSWGVQVANHFNLPYHNLSSTGRSTPFLIDHLFSYFKNYGHPKILICLFPEPTRMQVYSSPLHVISKNHLNKKSHLHKENLDDAKSITFNATMHISHNLDEKYSKLPHKAEDVIPVETAVAFSMQHIKFLEMYCKAAGIKLIWSTWDIPTEFALKDIDHEYENFISVENKYWHSREEDLFYDRMHSPGRQPYNLSSFNPYHDDSDRCTDFVDCHSELREKYGLNWDLASDVNRHSRHHWGIHRHTHIAEFFIEEIESNKWV